LTLLTLLTLDRYWTMTPMNWMRKKA